VRLRLAALCVAALALSASAGAAPAFKATFTASTHTPRTNAKWFYSVRATDLRGKPVKATITSQIVDPVGGVHGVEFGCCKRLVANHRFTGVFRDYVRFPPESEGFKLTFRVIVKALGAKRVLTYWVKSG
jgi:hypothetical protein